jgi:uncharacterized membrane protein YphA (DoxX/SURF4 family)
VKVWLARLERHWFEPRPEFDLGVFRVLFGAWLLYTWFARLWPRLEQATSRPAELALPPTLIRWLGLPVPVPEAALDVARWVFPLLALLVLVGLFTRVALVLATVLFVWFEGSHNAWGYTSHSTALPALVLVILCLAPGIERHSLDARKNSRLSLEPASAWPARLVLLLIVLFYAASGLSKLRYSGLGWLDGETLAFYLSGGSPRGTGSPQRFIADPELDAALRFRDGIGLVDYTWVASPPQLARRLSEHGWLMKATSALVLLLELSFPLALVGRRLRALYLGSAAAFHLGVYWLLRIDFMAYLVSYTLFVDWRSLGRWLRARTLRRPAARA